MSVCAREKEEICVCVLQVSGHVICVCVLQVSGHVEVATAAVKGGRLTEREERHVQALLAYSQGQLPTAINHWADILISYPRDLIAVRILFVSCVIIADFEKMRNVLAGVLPHWSKEMPSYPFILGL